MVGKIMKYELQAIFRARLYIAVVTLGLACISRIFMAVNARSIAGVIFCSLAIMSAATLMLTAFITSIVRFWRSLFKGEGYMTFSLPVSTSKLLISKLLSAIIAMFVGVAVAYLSYFIIFSGFYGETWDSVEEMFRDMLNMFGSYLASDPLLIVELILQIIVAVPMTLLLAFLVESIGQLATSHRLGVTFGIGVAFIVVFALLQSLCLEPILEAAARVNVHFAMWIQIIVYAGIDVSSFFLIRYLVSRKLNLIV